MKKYLSLVLSVLLCCGASLKVHAQLDPANNNPMPTSIAVDLADLLVLQDDPVVADGSTPFAVKVGLYSKIMNLVATSKEAHDVMYTDKIAPFITDSQDDQGNYHYTVVNGKADTLLGYSKCLNAAKFRDVLCKNSSGDYTVDAQVDSNQESYVWVYLSSTNTPPQTKDRPASGYHYYQYVNDAGDYYDFYQTLNDPKSGSDDNFGGELWVGIKDDSAPTHDWTVTGNNKDGLTTYSNGGPAKKVLSMQESAPEAKTSHRTWGEWWNGLTEDQSVGVGVTFGILAPLGSVAAIAYTFPGAVDAALGVALPVIIFGGIAWAIYQTGSAFCS